MELQPGDVFATRNPQGLGKLICWAQKLKSQDGEATYGHTGIILDAQGKTFEAVWTIREQDFYKAYKGNKVLIARWTKMSPEAFAKGFESVKPLKGCTYPYHRLILHALGMAKWIHWLKITVCSEITAMLLINAGAAMTCGKNPWGVTPDNLVDDWRINKHFEIVFEGELP